MKLKTTLAALGAAAVLAACGGGGGGSGSGGPSVNGGLSGAALTNAESFIAFMQSLVATADNTGEPLTLPETALPTSETAEPTAI